MESGAPLRIDKDANAPQWITPKYSTTLGIVRNRADRDLGFSTMSGTVFQDSQFSAADRRYRQKGPYIHTQEQSALREMFGHW